MHFSFSFTSHLNYFYGGGLDVSHVPSEADLCGPWPGLSGPLASGWGCGQEVREKEERGVDLLACLFSGNIAPG